MILTKARLLAKRVSRLPGLQRPIATAWNTYEHVLFSYHIRRNLREGDRVAEIDPLRVFWIAPNDVKAASGGSFDFLSDTGKIVDGRWDLDHGPEVTDSNLHSWFKKRFHHGCSWEETERYANGIRKVRQGQSKRYATVDHYKKKLHSYDRMYEAFEEGNYRLQSTLADDQAVGTPGDGGRALFPSLTDHTLMRHEIAVNVGRDGSLLWNDGRHRLFLAFVAGLEEIPVRIVVRHAEWQQLRDEVARTIDKAVEAGVSTDIKEHTSDVLCERLDDICFGLDHPDLDIIFQRRLSGEEL